MNNPSQNTATPSWLLGLLAFSLSLIIAAALAPSLGLVSYKQTDFVMLCVVASVFLSLPLVLMELALAKRAKSVPLQGMMQLTRDADAKTQWRISSWLGVVLMPLCAGGLLAFASQQVIQQQNLSLSPMIAVLILTVVAVALSMLPRMILLAVAAGAGLLAVVLGLGGDAQAWAWTAIEFKEWGKAVALVLVTTGLGFGVYWQLVVKNVAEREQLAPMALPIWLAQIVGLVAFSLLNLQNSMAVILLAVAGLALAGVLLNLTREQLLQRQVALPIQAVILLVPVLLWVLPITKVLFVIFILLALFNSLASSVFAGWIMKISHLRKSLQFSSEVSYNLWRVMVRIVVPLAVVLALISLILGLVG
ncbi:MULTISPECIES: hypothetical protein [unclassified Acinetobacter]|uniref:hypothetical protein n=1 Tax=unclassified Acinetobacter TaxID=196816 RepID=UPI0035BABA9D